jgi:hypothetical protein
MRVCLINIVIAGEAALCVARSPGEKVSAAAEAAAGCRRANGGAGMAGAQGWGGRGAVPGFGA